MLRTTIVGGMLFLLPVILILFLLSKGLKFARRLAEPVAHAAHLNTVGGLAASTIIAIAALALISFLAGMLARTGFGHKIASAFEGSILGLVPEWRMARGLLESFDRDRHSNVDVVLVPTDAGWSIGFVLEKPEGEWWPVFVPGAPRWTSGFIAYARSEQVHHTDLSFAQAILLMRRCGAGSRDILTLLESLEQKGTLPPLAGSRGPRAAKIGHRRATRAGARKIQKTVGRPRQEFS